MRITVIGTGVVGRTLAGAFQELGHDVVVGTRDPDATGTREEWAGVGVPLQPLATAAADAELVVNATNGEASLAALGEVGTDHLDGKVLLDVANPLDFSAGFPPDAQRQGHRLPRRAAPARLPGRPGGEVAEHDDRERDGRPRRRSATATPRCSSPATTARPARRSSGLLEQLGWSDIVELDGLHNARGLEMWLPLWVRLMGALGTAEFNIKVVR